MSSKSISILLGLWTIGMVGSGALAAQEPADLLVVNAKILTLDDSSFNSSPGTIAEAMAIRQSRIVAIGSNAEIRGMAGNDTQVMDLKGRMVVPGFIITHEHPSDWDMTNSYLVKKVIPEDVAIHVFTEGPPEEQLKQLEEGVKEAEARAKPGQWIRGVLSFGDNYQYYRTVRGWFSAGHGHPYVPEPRILKEHLDELAPNHPLTVRAAFTGASYNSKAIEVIAASTAPGADVIEINPQTGIGAGVGGYRQFEPEILFKDRVDLLVELQRLGLGWMAGYGITSFNTSVYAPNFLRAYKELDRRGEMAIRMSWAWGWPYDTGDDYLLADLATRFGEGSDYLWFGGMGEPGGVGGNCTTLTPRTEYGKTMKTRCALIPGAPLYKQLYAAIKAGVRLTGFHTDGDRDLDNLLRLIQNASREGGLSREDIRAQRHGIDHGYGSPRPDQALTIAGMGMVMGMMNISIFERPPFEAQHFGEQILEMIIPRQTAVKARLMTSFEIDRPMAFTNWNVFDLLSLGVTRKSWDGKVYGLRQATSPVIQLKAGTIWGAYYLKKEDDLGSLEPGKFGDFIVIDKDFLTIGDEQINDVNVLMSVVGGKVEHLVPSLARELGLEPTGIQVELGSPTVRLIEGN